MSEIEIHQECNEFFLSCQNGAVTTKKRWTDKEKAEKARKREQGLADNNKPSRMRWEYGGKDESSI